MIEPAISKRYNLACATIEDSDQPARPRRLIRVFNGRSMGSQGSNASSGRKMSLRPECADAQTDLNIRCTRMPPCTLRWLPGYNEM